MLLGAFTIIIIIIELDDMLNNDVSHSYVSKSYFISYLQVLLSLYTISIATSNKLFEVMMLWWVKLDKKKQLVKQEKNFLLGF